MSTITIDSNIYEKAEQYAHSHNVSVRTLVESYFRRLVHTSNEKKSVPMKELKDLSPEVRQLIGIVSPKEKDGQDLNGEKYRTDYLNEKYS